MEKINKPKDLPESKIINELILKANAKTDYEFNYLSQLEEFRKIISIEVSRINLLFPEYTPHDENYHLKRLFYVADLMLGDEIISSMNVTELFLLSVSLYGHDWGMAMSEEEKHFILTGYTDSASHTVNLLHDEKFRIKEYCKNNNLEQEKMQIEDWKEYVRITHAFRSGSRIKKHFEPISSGVADFASRICEGHWLDFSVIEDHTSYPTDASIHRETVNIKALTIYVRLIDLLDLGEDRTPFILWKFVAPRNKLSKIEWSKHRALQPVTFPTYQLARTIQIEGSTDDQNVYMSIMDLKRYVDTQFRQSLDILNRINHNYHKLNISHIDWRIASKGFEPVTIQFEFDRNRMFDILGDEIYRSNPYVFIRELLQNAIDAIEMRKELLEKEEISFSPKIQLQINEDDTFYTVTITDNGIGMDEYIIRNYLSVAGKSYYRSSDFKNEGLKMDPISRFGIGVLSCFMTADYIEIETFKDPHTTKNPEHLKITIPSKENYFKISKNTEIFKIGTSFRVFVIKSKLPKSKKTGLSINFNVTEYLKRVAGFVKYPISISEDNNESLIINPNTIIESRSSKFSVDYRFPIGKAILPQSKDVVEEYFIEKRFYLNKDLKMTGFDGCITFLIPKTESLDLENTSYSWPLSECSLIDFKNPLKKGIKIKWEDSWASFHSYYYEDDIILPERSYNVFIDGILINEISPPQIEFRKREDDLLNDFYNRYGDSFMTPQLIVNIPKPPGMKIDLARTNIETTEKWDKPVWLAFFEYLKVHLFKDIMLKAPKERLLGLARLITFYKLTDEIIIEFFLANKKFPITFISNEGVLLVEEFDLIKHEELRRVPSEFSEDFLKLLQSNYLSNVNYTGILRLWEGENNALLDLFDSYRFEALSFSISNMCALTRAFIRRNYYIHNIEFVNSPLGDEFPLIQEVLKLKPDSFPLKKSDITVDKLDVESSDNFDISIVNVLLKSEFRSFPLCVKFPSPHSTKMFYGLEYLNADNEMIKSFLKVCISVIKTKKNGSISKDIVGKLYDKISEFINFDKFRFNKDGKRINELNSQMHEILEFAVQNRFIESGHLVVFEINSEAFVKNSVIILKKKTAIRKMEFEDYCKGNEKWGQKIL